MPLIALRIEPKQRILRDLVSILAAVVYVIVCCEYNILAGGLVLQESAQNIFHRIGIQRDEV